MASERSDIFAPRGRLNDSCLDLNFIFMFMLSSKVADVARGLPSLIAATKEELMSTELPRGI